MCETDDQTELIKPTNLITKRTIDELMVLSDRFEGAGDLEYAETCRLLTQRRLYKGIEPEILPLIGAEYGNARKAFRYSLAVLNFMLPRWSNYILLNKKILFALFGSKTPIDEQVFVAIIDSTDTYIEFNPFFMVKAIGNKSHSPVPAFRWQNNGTNLFEPKNNTFKLPKWTRKERREFHRQMSTLTEVDEATSRYFKPGQLS